MFKKFCLFLLAMSPSVLVHSGSYSADSLRSQGRVINLDWDRGIVQGDNIGIAWNIHSCGRDASFVCLIVEGIGIELAYPKSIEPGDSWYFDGRIYKLAMDSSGQLLIISRYSYASMSANDGPDRNRINLIRVTGNRLQEFVSYEDTPQFREIIRWRSETKEGVNLAPSLTADTKTLKVGGELIENCLAASSINCLKR